MGLFDNRAEGIMVFEELLESGAAPDQLRWIFTLLVVEGSPTLTIWEKHEGALAADIRDHMLRVTRHPPPGLVRNELLIALQHLLQGLGKSLTEIGLPEPTERRQGVYAECIRWGGDPTNLCAFKDGLTAEQVVIIFSLISEVATDGHAGQGVTETELPDMDYLLHVMCLRGPRLTSFRSYCGSETFKYS
jgi:hypothetical protein